MPVGAIEPGRWTVIGNEHHESPLWNENAGNLRKHGPFVSHIFEKVCQDKLLEFAVTKWQVRGGHRNHARVSCRLPGNLMHRYAMPIQLDLRRLTGWCPVPGLETELLRVDHNWRNSQLAPEAVFGARSTQPKVCQRMELYSLHPIPDNAASTFLQLLSPLALPADGNTVDHLRGRFWFDRIAGAVDPRPNDLTFGLGAWLATSQPVFARPGLSLSSWEAQVDRGSGMLLRPPSRMFIDAGLDPALARAMPIRIERGDGMMGGAWVPARSMEDYLGRLDANLERSVRRMNEAELDGAAMMGLMYEAARYAHSSGFGLYEVVDLLDPTDRATWPPDSRVIVCTSDKALEDRIRLATEPRKEPGLIARLLGRKK
jgi:hypothetical protein